MNRRMLKDPSGARGVTAMVVAGALLLSACGQGATGPAAGGATATQVLKIGAAVALTGPVSKEGNLVKDGYEIWQKAVNDKGGLTVGSTRYKVDFVFYDDESKADTASRLTEKLITEDKVSFILGPFSSGITTATSTISERYKVLTIAPQANADGIYERGYKYIFSVLPPASNYLKGLVDMGLTLSPQPRRLAVLIRDDPFGIAAGEGAAKYAATKGYDVVFKEKFPANATDVSTILTRVKATTPDVMLASTLFQDSVLLTKQAKDLQFAPKLSGFTAGPALADFVSSLGKDAEFVYGSEWWLPSLNYTGAVFGSTKDYAELVRKAKGYEPGYHVASGSMAGLVLQLAIEKAGTIETEAVRKALLALDPQTFWGPIGWDESGKNIRGTSIPVQIQGGKVTAVWPKEGRQAEPKYPTPAWSAR
ncbi:MAG: amino acid ABC transporter substrate-binding protein [Candidatus Limnocylindria bacterium]|nr:amino acid ABC transporter substrate-binding protein [Candidatus Limnocylindria bacterium]